MRVFLECRPNHYVGEFPTVTIHYQPKNYDQAEELRSRIHEIMDELILDIPKKP